MGRGMEGEWNKMDDIRNSGLMPELSDSAKRLFPHLFVNPFF